MGKITRARIKQLNEIGEEVIFERMLAGNTVKSLLAEWGMGWGTWYKWLDSEDGRKDRYDETLRNAGHAYAQRAVETAQNATNENVTVARLQVDTDKWIASKLNSAYDVRQKETTVTLRIEDLHSQAAALISQEAERSVMDAIEGAAEEVEDDDGGGGAEEA
jgi:hypothetical protein